MDFKQLTEANKFIKTTDIKGKEYAEVNQRIKAFRYLYPEGTIETEMLSNDGAICVFRAVVKNENDKVLGTGTAFEQKDSTFINKTSYIENCETSAVGRALAMCGIGIDVSIASAEEVTNAINNQTEAKPKPVEPKQAYPTRDEMLALVKKKYPEGSKPLNQLLTNNNLNSIEDMNNAQLMAIYNRYARA